MALQKQIELDNGIIVNYHRIVSINKITNNCSIIEVASYINQDKRQQEIEYYKNKNTSKPINVFIYTEYINKKYNEAETIKEAYDHLKTLDKYKDAIDI